MVTVRMVAVLGEAPVEVVAIVETRGVSAGVAAAAVAAPPIMAACVGLGGGVTFPPLQPAENEANARTTGSRRRVIGVLFTSEILPWARGPPAVLASRAMDSLHRRDLLKGAFSLGGGLLLAFHLPNLAEAA